MSTIKPKVREALKRGQFTEVNDDEVDYEFTSPSQFFSQNLTLLPMISTVQSQRQFYTDKFFNQALPLVHGEAPLVRSLKDEKTGETFESYIGNQTGVVRAEDDDDGATITDVSPDYIKYKTKAGKEKRKSLYNNFAFNRKTYATNTPLVKKGDTIKKGQLLAKTNYTDNEGNLNMGLNARIAVVPYKGWSFEDAVVISEDFAKRLASQHMYSMSQDFSSADERKNTTTNRDHFTSLFPKKFTKDQLTNIDENGVVKVGTVVKHGDPLILATRPRMVSSKDSDLGRLSKYLGKTRTDASLAWEHEADGIVTDVVKTKHGWKVNVRSEQPARPGDKLSIGRSGSKGTISKIIPQNLVPRTLDGRPVDVLFNPLGIPCYSSDTEILTDKGWISVVAADGSYKYMTLNPDTWCMELQEASHIHHYDYNGPMYHYNNSAIDILVTPNHRMYYTANVVDYTDPKVWFLDSTEHILTTTSSDQTLYMLGVSSLEKQEKIYLEFIKENITTVSNTDGQVHCVTVPNGIVFVRRNGKAVFSGNSRVNANLIMSMMLGKVADKTGKPIKIKSFNNRDEKWYEYVENLMKEHNITDVEDLYDPEKDRLLDNPVTVGNDYIIKMHHTAESKFSARGAGPVYTSDEQPARGGEPGLGCFVAGQTITSMYGPIDIGTVCERKMRIPVMSFDFDKREWCFKNITNWFTYRAKPEDIITVRFCTNAFRKIGMPFKMFNPAAIHVTKNHKVFRKDGSKVAIGDLNVGDKLYTYGPVPTDDQYALLYGTMLGDGYAHKNEDSIRIEHSYSQINYIKWKHSVLSGLLSRTYDHRRERNSKSSLVQKPFRSTSLTLSYPYLCKEIRQLCYSSEGRKTVTKEWLDKLTPLSIAVLIADDGCIYWSNTGRKCGLNLFMYSFTQEENEMLAARIKELTGIEFHLNNGYRYDGKKITKVYEAGLMCAYKKEDIIKAAKLILQYIPLDCLPQAKRSSIKRCLNIQDDRDYVRTIDIQPKIDLIPVEITSIEQYKPEKPNVTEINVYDFTVEDTHTYLAGNVLVSNSKQYSGLENNGIFSAGAYEIAKDAIHVRGQKNDDYWRAVRNGETPTLAKKSPFVWDKYIALMQGAGINTIDRGNGILQASPFTDRQFSAMNPKELDNPYIVDLNNMKPVVGGLFDPTNSLTDRWGKITLNEPYPNPGFEDAIANLLGLKKSEMYKVMTGEKDLNGKVGTKALQSALKSIDMDKMMAEAKQQFKHGPKSLKQKALNTMRYIKGLKANGLTPDELMITMVPVLPSKFRPYSAMGDTFIPGDANELYKDVFQMRNAQKQLEDELGPEEAMQNSMNMYASIKALYGFGDSLNKKIQQRGVSGFLDKLVGGTSKFSYLNRHVNAKPVDLTARSVIDVDPDLGMNEIGLPTKMAYTLFGPYIQQKLVQWGMSPAEAVEAIAREQEHLNK